VRRPARSGAVLGRVSPRSTGTFFFGVYVLAPQKRFAHLLQPESAGSLAHVQQRVDDEWARLLELCA